MVSSTFLNVQNNPYQPYRIMQNSAAGFPQHSIPVSSVLIQQYKQLADLNAKNYQLMKDQLEKTNNLLDGRAEFKAKIKKAGVIGAIAGGTVSFLAHLLLGRVSLLGPALTAGIWGLVGMGISAWRNS